MKGDAVELGTRRQHAWEVHETPAGDVPLPATPEITVNPSMRLHRRAALTRLELFYLSAVWFGTR
jgi:hypothetical protein